MGLESLRNCVTALAKATAARLAKPLFAEPTMRKQYHGRQLLHNNDADKATTSELISHDTDTQDLCNITN